MSGPGGGVGPVSRLAGGPAASVARVAGDTLDPAHCRAVDELRRNGAPSCHAFVSLTKCPLCALAIFCGRSPHDRARGPRRPAQPGLPQSGAARLGTQCRQTFTESFTSQSFSGEP